MKKKKTILLASGLLILNVLSYPIGVYADSYEKNAETSVVDEYLEMQKATNTGHINEKKEKQLNEQGVYDDEVLLFDEKMQKNIEEAEVWNVAIEYVSVAEDGESHIMSEDEIDNFIETKYGNDLNKYRKQKQDKNFMTKALKTIGIVPEQVYATVKSNYSDSKVFKKTLIITQQKKGSNTAHVTAYYTWLTAPAYRCEDTAFLFFEGADILDNSNASCHYYYKSTSRHKGSSYNSTWTYFQNCVPVKVNYTSNMKKNWVINSGMTSFAYVYVDLKNDYIYSDDGVLENRYTDHYIVMQMDVKKDEYDKDNTFIGISKYYHQQKAYSLTPSISIGLQGDISFSGDLGQDKYNHIMGVALNLDFRWK